MPSSPAVNGWRLVGASAGRRRADRRDRGGVDDPLDPGLERLLHHDPGAADVDLEDALAIGRRAARSCRRRGRRGRRPSIARRTARRSVTSPVDALELEAPARCSVGRPRRTSRRSSSPRAASARARWEPMKPVPPVTSVLRHRARMVVMAAQRPARRVIQAPGEPRRQTAIVCDTTSYLPDEMLAEHGIQRVSLYVALDGEQRRESRDQRLRHLLRAPARAARRARRPHSPRSATSSRSTSRCSRRAARSSRSTSPPGSRGPSSRPTRRASG